MISISTGIVPISNSMLVLAIHYNNIIHISCPHSLLDECLSTRYSSLPRVLDAKSTKVRQGENDDSSVRILNVHLNSPPPPFLSLSQPSAHNTHSQTQRVYLPPTSYPFFSFLFFFLGLGPFPQTTSSSPPELNAGAPDHALSCKII